LYRVSPPVNIYVSGVAWNRASVLALLPLLACRGCGQCCVKPEGVLVQDYEAERIAGHLGCEVVELQAGWARVPEGWLMPTPCRFRTLLGCAIYAARPVVCKYYPLYRCQQQGTRATVGVWTAWCQAGARAIGQLQMWERGG